MIAWLRAGSIGWLLVLAGAPAVSARAAMPPTHGMALDAVADTVAAELLRGASFPAGRPVTIVAPAPGDTLGLLTQRLLERLKTLGVPVRLAPPGHGLTPTSESGGQVAPNGTAPPNTTATPDSGGAMPGDSTANAAAAVPRPTDPVERPLRLQVQVEGSGVSYVRRLGSFPFGTKGYERLAGMRASATLFDPVNGDVVWTRSAARNASDVVAKGDVAYATSGSGGLNPPVPRGGGTRWLEPMIVVGVVAGLVVLFYSNRN